MRASIFTGMRVVIVGMVLLSMSAFVFPVLADNADHDAPNVQLSAGSATGREVEDTTQKAIVRDYTAAWAALTTALATNDAGALDASFAGIAHDELASRVTGQRKAGLHTQITDRGHRLEAVVYTPEGSAMQLHDTAEVDIQIMDGGKVIHSEHATLHYVVLMTVAEDRWKVRLLQEVSGF
jgi:hypothetical protein